MRTIASNVMTKGEAMTAGRRLEAIGVPPEQIQLKEVEGSGVFVSAKVAPEHVDAANKILKDRPAEPAVAPDAADAHASREPAAVRESLDRPRPEAVPRRNLPLGEPPRPAAAAPPAVAVQAGRDAATARRPSGGAGLMSRLDNIGWLQMLVILAVLGALGIAFGALLGAIIY